MRKRSNKIAKKRPEGSWEIRVYHKKGKGKKSPRYLLKCGCCNESIHVYYDRDGLEINGVNGSIEDWREILLPLLRLRAGNNGMQRMPRGNREGK